MDKRVVPGADRAFLETTQTCHLHSRVQKTLVQEASLLPDSYRSRFHVQIWQVVTNVTIPFHISE